MKSYVFKVVVEDDEREDGRKATMRTVPNSKKLWPWGETIAEAMRRINELLNVLAQMRLEKDQPIPGAIELESTAVVVTV